MTEDDVCSRAAVPVDPPARVGVVVPAYNAELYLAETLRSVQAQTIADWRCVIVDDGSSDDTAAIAAEFADRDGRFQLHRQVNSGVSSARNKAIDILSDTPWLAFLDSDDTWLPDALEVLLDAVATRPDAVAVYGLAEYMDETGRPVHAGQHPHIQRDRRQPGTVDLRGVDANADGTFAVLAVSGTVWPPATGLFRRTAVIRAGLFDAEQRYVEDWDLYIRMSRVGPFVPVERQVAWYRQHDAELTRNDQLMAFYYLRVRWKTYVSADNTPAQRRMVRRVWLSLQLRSVVWTAYAGVRAWRERDRGIARDALIATVLFTAQLFAGRPRRPTERSARYTAQFIATRRPRFEAPAVDALTPTCPSSPERML